jgi:hypothetical protein
MKKKILRMKVGNEKRESGCTVYKLWSQWGKVIKEERKQNEDGDLLGK